jgi:hypothetical protein
MDGPNETGHCEEKRYERIQLKLESNQDTTEISVTHGLTLPSETEILPPVDNHLLSVWVKIVEYVVLNIRACNKTSEL